MQHPSEQSAIQDEDSAFIMAMERIEADLWNLRIWRQLGVRPDEIFQDMHNYTNHQKTGSAVIRKKWILDSLILNSAFAEFGLIH